MTWRRGEVAAGIGRGGKKKRRKERAVKEIGDSGGGQRGSRGKVGTELECQLIRIQANKDGDMPLCVWLYSQA